MKLIACALGCDATIARRHERFAADGLCGAVALANYWLESDDHCSIMNPIRSGRADNKS
jgi:hypothetical protein